jgi:hypothetical protein
MRKVVGRGALQAHRRGNDNAHRRMRTRPVLQTSILPRVIAEYQPGKLATTETRQALIFGSLRATLVLGASGPERATAFAPTSTATVVVETARPFTTVSVVAECRSFGPAAKEPLGACAGDSTGRDVGAPVVATTFGALCLTWLRRPRGALLRAAAQSFRPDREVALVFTGSGWLSLRAFVASASAPP